MCEWFSSRSVKFEVRPSSFPRSRVLLSAPIKAAPNLFLGLPLPGTSPPDLHLGPAVRPECFPFDPSAFLLPRVLQRYPVFRRTSDPSCFLRTPVFRLLLKPVYVSGPWTSKFQSDPPSPSLVSAFTQSGVTFLFSASRPAALRLQTFSSAFSLSRARPFSLFQQSMTATWRACSSGKLRVFLHVWRHTTARARTSLLSKAFLAPLNTAGKLPAIFLFLLSPREPELSVLASKPQLSSPAAFLLPHKSGRCIRALPTPPPVCSNQTAGLLFGFTGLPCSSPVSLLFLVQHCRHYW
jgi:hypothetical protein